MNRNKHRHCDPGQDPGEAIQKRKWIATSNLTVLLAMTVLVLFSFSGVKAANYDPGTVGYLYERCREDLHQSASLGNAFGSYCGGFAEGYVAGIIAASPPTLPDPAKGSPCYDDMKAAFDTLNNRFCPALPFDFRSNASIEAVVTNVLDVFSAWVREGQLKDGAAFFAQDVRETAKIIQPGAFCTHYEESKLQPQSGPVFQANPALFSLGWNDLQAMTMVSSEESKYNQCAQDLRRSGKDRTEFLTTRCGAEISGFLAGLGTTAHLSEATPASSPSCRKQMRRLFRSVNTSETMCVDAATHPYTVARIYIENFHLISQSGSVMPASSFLDLGALAAPGYQTIYRGFLCRNKQELERR